MDKLEKFLYDNSLNSFYGKMGYKDTDEAEREYRRKQQAIKRILNTKYGIVQLIIKEERNNVNK